MSTYVWRPVVDAVFLVTKYNRPGEGTLRHALSCGHKILRKKSYGEHKKMRCRECERQRP